MTSRQEHTLGPSGVERVYLLSGKVVPAGISGRVSDEDCDVCERGKLVAMCRWCGAPTCCTNCCAALESNREKDGDDVDD